MVAPPQCLRVAQAVRIHRSWVLAGCLQHHQGTCSWPHSTLRATEARWVIIGNRSSEQRAALLRLRYSRATQQVCFNTTPPQTSERESVCWFGTLPQVSGVPWCTHCWRKWGHFHVWGAGFTLSHSLILASTDLPKLAFLMFTEHIFQLQTSPLLIPQLSFKAQALTCSFQLDAI